MQLLIKTILIILPILGSPFRQTCNVLMPEIGEEYVGNCRRGLAHGKGIASGEDFYQGEFRRGFPHGAGTYTWSNGDTYEGAWRRGQMHGQGTFTIAENDSAFYGYWVNNEFKRLVDTTAVKQIPNYEIYYQRNLISTRFLRVIDGDKVLFTFRDQSANRRVRNIHTLGTSGNYISYGRFFGFENVTFPFEGKISFLAPSRTGEVVFQIDLFFKINQPGSWEVQLSF
jgi:hypothetical protein